MTVVYEDIISYVVLKSSGEIVYGDGAPCISSSAIREHDTYRL